MGRLFGFISNRPELGARALHHYSDQLAITSSAETPVGWGVGFYQSGEVLLRRRPLDERPLIRVDAAVENVHTDILIGQVRKPTVGALRAENTHPFRYREWLFAHAGTIGGFEKLRDRLLETQPEFLRRNRRGETDSEMFFYLFLSFMHDAGSLQVSIATPEQIVSALRACITLIDQLSLEEGHPKNSCDVLLTNGEYLIALHRSGTMAHRVIKGRHDVEGFLADELAASSRAMSLEKARCCLIAGGLDEVPRDWERTPAPSISTFTRTEDPTLEML